MYHSSSLTVPRIPQLPLLQLFSLLRLPFQLLPLILMHHLHQLCLAMSEQSTVRQRAQQQQEKKKLTLKPEPETEQEQEQEPAHLHNLQSSRTGPRQGLALQSCP
mmetsp:Transcript_57193/g.125191  ORF Transcript_57193/g.125191 Transcript_57193/m.125191 type:complete len:105 (+) Transcript_57193:449-763(+)